MTSMAHSEELRRDAEREIVNVRVLLAPRERVWRAWIDSRVLAHWWGPRGFTNTFDEHDPRPGGRWRFVMHGPDGTRYRNESVYVELREPARIVIDHVSGPRFRLTATFDEVPGGTRVTFRQRFETAAAYAQALTYAPEKNEENLDRLAAVVRWD